MEFNIGDKVRFKTWEELKEEFGLKPNGMINCRFGFIPEMDEDIDREQIYTISRILNNGRVDFEEPISSRYNYSIDMIRPYSQEEDLYQKNINYWRNMLLDVSSINPVSNYVRMSMGFGCQGLKNVILGLILKNKVENMNENHYICEVVSYDNPPDVVINYYDTNYPSDYHKAIILKTRKFAEMREGYIGITDFGMKILKETEDYIFIRFEEINLLFCLVKGEKMSSNEFFEEFIQECINYFPDAKDEVLNKLLLEGKHEEAIKYVNFLYDEVLKYAKKKNFDFFLNKIKEIEEKGKEKGLNNQLEDAEDEVQELERTLIRAQEKMHEIQKEIAYLKYANKSGATDFVDAIKNSFEDIVIYKLIGGTGIAMHYKQPLIFFDDDNWKIVRKGFLESNGGEAAGLIDAIFARRATLMMETGFKIDFNRNTVERYVIDEHTQGIPNPHIYSYDCWGDNGPYIRKALREGKNDIAFEQIKSALAGINVTDSPVMQKFAYYLSTCDYERINCITDNVTGEVMTVKEARKFYENFKPEED